MHSHVDYCWHKAFLNRVIKTLICFCLVYTPFFANAGAAEKWDIIENVYDASQTVRITARKAGTAANSGVYKVNVPVNASTLGASVKTMLWAGVAVAGVQAMLEGIGWIIDTGSQVIKREKPQDNDPTHAYFWCASYYNSCSSSPSVAAEKFFSEMSVKYSRYTIKYFSNANIYEVAAYSVDNPDILTSTFNVHWTKNPFYSPEAPEPEYEIMSDSKLGEEIMGSGENPNPLPDAITQAYNPNPNPVSQPAQKEADKVLEASNPEPETPPKSESETVKEKDENGEETGKETTTTTWPAACEWFPAACDFFLSQKKSNEEIKENQKEQVAQNKSFFEKAKEWFDWTKDNPDIPEDNEIPEITGLDIGQLDTGTFKATPGCPQPVQVPVSLGGSGSISISYEPICSFASKWSFVAPLIGFLSGAMIIVGVGRKGEDGEL